MAASKPTEISATELEIKRRGRRRLIGAITLGLLAIVFLPMIFDSEPKRAGDAGKTQEIAVQVPSRENQPPLPAPTPTPLATPAVTSAPEAAKVAPEPAPAREAPPVVAKEPPKVAAAALNPAKVPEKAPGKAAQKESPREAAKVAPKTEKADKGEKTARAAVVKDGFYVQLGVYTRAENADKEIARVKEAKLPVHTDTIPVKAGNATRVRVGPFATREKADAALAQIKLAGGDGKIVPTK